MFLVSSQASSITANMAEIDQLRSKMQQKAAAASKLQLSSDDIKSSETGEAEGTSNKPLAEKASTNVFTLKQTAPLAAAKVINVPDIVKTSNQAATKVESKTKEEVKDKEKSMIKLKENVPEKENKKVLNEPQKPTDDKKDEAKPFNLSNNQKPAFSLTPSMQSEYNIFIREHNYTF